jgi:hypothetical protein
LKQVGALICEGAHGDNALSSLSSALNDLVALSVDVLSSDNVSLNLSESGAGRRVPGDDDLAVNDVSR